INSNLWEVSTQEAQRLTVRYTYLANTMDAGGSWIDESQWYINWINCLFYVVGRQDEPFSIFLDIPDHWQIATSLSKEGKKLIALHYEDAAESPVICSPTLQLNSYTIQNHRFHIAVQGNIHIDWEVVIPLFEAFTRKQIELFGDFPCKEYYFLYQILSSPFYHGVEHTNSTVIVLGSSAEFQQKEKFKEFLGISSHELFHTWNVKRIRPAEMQPYDYTQPCYFPSGFIVEGITTYYGDLMLLRSGVFSWEDYVDELNNLLKIHLENTGKLSLRDASIDLWVDGYEKNTPPRKPSIYTKGCLVALLLDLEIRQATNHQFSLDDVMRKLWSDYQSEKPYKGYTIESFMEIVAGFVGKEKATDWYEECIEGNTDL
ncbi:MAG: M61 family peptidase, partial [Flammeovirgaceae bacterium]|nr:M61 family peptidase [Flammeovirgaceae bacterium]MDW8288914.1 M61 family peptidase [Flammeovirgaceae bacterium]